MSLKAMSIHTAYILALYFRCQLPEEIPIGSKERSDSRITHLSKNSLKPRGKYKARLYASTLNRTTAQVAEVTVTN